MRRAQVITVKDKLLNVGDHDPAKILGQYPGLPADSERVQRYVVTVLPDMLVRRPEAVTWEAFLVKIYGKTSWLRAHMTKCGGYEPDESRRRESRTSDFDSSDSERSALDS